MGLITSSSRELEFLGLILASETDQKIELLMVEFALLIKQIRRNSSGLDSNQMIISEEVNPFSELESFFERITIILMLESAMKLSSLFDVSLPTRLNQRRVIAARKKLKLRLNGFIEEAKLMDLASVDASASSSIDLVLTPRNVDSLRKACEFSACFSANHGIFQSGMETFHRKRSVSVLDRDTTNLCRLRMHGQVVNWDRYFVDPISGSRWLHPPFIGGKLSKSEVFHSCRSIGVPA